MKFWLESFLCLAVLSAGSPAFAASVKELNKKIKTNEKELEKVQRQIKDLETEKGRLKQDEESLAQLLKKIQNETDQSVRRQLKLQKQIHETELQMNRTSQEIINLTSEENRWEDAVLNDLKIYYVQSVRSERLINRPLYDWLYRRIAGLEYQRLKDTEFRKEIVSNKQKRLLRYQKNLAVLKENVELEIAQQKERQKEKEELYKTTVGKRLITEQEVRRLRETSKMLEKLIGDITRKRDKSAAAERQAELSKKSFILKKGSFDWPSAGTVLLRFGKQKHSDLNVFIINDGIKLKTSAHSPVKAIEKGVVVYAADFRSYGPTVILDHGGDFYSIYGLLGNVLVQEGDSIETGAVLGSAPDHNAQLYFEIRNQGKAEDPLLWLK